MSPDLSFKLPFPVGKLRQFGRGETANSLIWLTLWLVGVQVLGAGAVISCR